MWYHLNPDGTRGAPLSDEENEHYANQQQHPVWTPIADTLKTVSNLLGLGQSGGFPDLSTIRPKDHPFIGDTPREETGKVAPLVLSALLDLPPYVTIPMAGGASALVESLSGGKHPYEAAASGAGTMASYELGNKLGGVGGRIAFKDRDLGLRDDRIADWISSKFNVKLTGKDLESQLVRGGPSTGLPTKVPTEGSQALSWDNYGVPNIAPGKRKDAAIYLKQAFSKAWDTQKHQLDQPRLVEQIRGPLWDDLVRTMGLDDAQQLLNVVSNHPLGMAAGETGRLADIPSEPMSTRIHPGIPPSVSIHPGSSYQMSGQPPDWMRALKPASSLMAGYAEPTINRFVSGPAAAPPMPLAAPLPVPPAPAAAPASPPTAAPNAAATGLPTRAPIAVPAAAHGGGPAWYAPSRTRAGFHAAPTAAPGPSARATTSANLPRSVRPSLAQVDLGGIGIEFLGDAYEKWGHEPLTNVLSRFMPRERAAKITKGVADVLSHPATTTATNYLTARAGHEALKSAHRGIRSVTGPVFGVRSALEKYGSLSEEELARAVEAAIKEFKPVTEANWQELGAWVSQHQIAQKLRGIAAAEATAAEEGAVLP